MQPSINSFSWRGVSDLCRPLLMLLIIVALLLSGPAAAALAAPITLDPTFDTDGKVTTIFGTGDDYGNAMVIQSDGKIVVAGVGWNGSTTDIALARYNTNGGLDSTFDFDGKAITPIGSSHDGANAMAIQSDGKLVVAGSAYVGSTTDIALARYNTNGSLDTTFDGDGKLTTNFDGNNDFATAVAIQSDGKIVVAGYKVVDSVFFDYDVVLARYNANGSLDTTFDGDGKLTTSFGPNIDNAFAVAIQSDGKIVMAGGAIVGGGGYKFALARYNANGSLDSAFDGDGKLTTAIGTSDTAYALAIQSDGKLVAAGGSFAGSNGDVALARYNSDGSLDTTFDGDGMLTTDFGSNYDYAYALVLQRDGKPAVAGWTSANITADFALARYNTDGSLDTNFDTDGKLITAIGSGMDQAYALAVQSDGKLVAAGIAHNGTNRDVALVRYGAEAPIAAEDSYILNQGQTLNVPAPGVLENDSSSAPLTAQLVDTPTHGSLTLNPDGSFSYTPDPGYCDTDSFTYQASNGTLSSEVTWVGLEIACVNQAPVATDANLTTNEDTPASGTLAASDADNDGLTYSIVTNGAKGVATITDPATGAFTYTPYPDANGGDTFTFQASDGTDDSNVATVDVTITLVNDQPSFTGGAGQTVPEDAGAQSVVGWATAVSAGPADESAQTLTFLITANDNPGLFSAGPAVNANGELTFTPAADANGVANLTLALNDNGGTANGGQDTSAAYPFTIAVLPADDPPTLDPIADMSLPLNAPAQIVNLSGISAGPPDESKQPLLISATSDNPTLIADPAVTYSSPDATGTLSFTPAAGLSGSATITVLVEEDGFEGPTRTTTRTFVVFVGDINHRPTLDQPGDLSILEDAGAQTVNLSGISTGSEGESRQQLTVTATSSNPALIANPVVSYLSPSTTGSLSFTPAANGNGTATITVTVTDDGGTAGGGIDFIARAFTVAIAPVNDAPDFTAGANQSVVSGAGARTVAGWASGFTPGPADEAGQAVLAYQVVGNSNPALFAVAPAVAPNGTLTYTPQPGSTGTATASLVVRDSGGTANGGIDTSAVKTFTIAVGAGYRVYMPLMARVGAPDLVIASVGISPNKPSYAAGEPVEITVVIENRGDAAAEAFWVDLSINPDQPPTVVNRPWHQHCVLKPCFGLAWAVMGLQPGERLTLTSKQLPVGYSIWPGWLASGTTDMYAYIDSYNKGVALGAVAERDETNNQFHLGNLAVTGTNPPLAGLRSIADLSRRPARVR